MNDRETVYEKLRGALAPLPHKSPYPDWDDALTVCRAHPQFDTPWNLFAHKFSQVNGIAISGLEKLAAWMHGAELTVGYCDPGLLAKLPDIPAFKGITINDTFDSERYDDYQFGITRASAVIAETGTIVLKDAETASRLGALAPWTHIALLDGGPVFEFVHQALEHFGTDPAVVWVTGPSKTADVEGILIEGVHGPGVQVCCQVDA